MKTYLRNQRYEEAKKIVEPLYERYPTSSILRVLLIEIYQLEADNNAIEELKQNIELDDENYHITLAMKFVDVQELFRMSYNDMEKVLDNYAEATDNELIAISGKLIKALRLKDNKAIKKNIDKLMDISLDLGNIHGIKTYAPMYGDILNDEERSIKLLEDFNEEYFDLSVQRKLMVHYNGLNKRDKVIRMLEENVSRFEFDIAFYEEIIGFMLYAEEYKSALSYSDKMLELFPYSFMAMAYKGDALLQLGRIEEATEWYTKSLVHNSGNATLRQKIRDIRQEKDLIEEFRIEDAYQFIKDKRGVTKENNYGYNILLDEIIVELFEEAGGKQRSVQVYEITSEKGIESLKEYNLGLRYNYSIIKSEIVKKNGAVMPSEGNGSSFVFNGLEVGDVIYIDYQVNFNGSGRFFRDFVETHQFNSYHPTSLVSYTLLVPKDIEIFQNVTNGTLDYTKTDLETHVVHNWKLTDDSGLSTPEDYMPVNADVVTLLHLSTIENWSDIANWYSDLVRSQMEINSEVEKTFSSIFPDGTEELSEEKIAELIYRYIADNMSYSYVSFKQSGFVPQKPSKTITSKLGDCKDLSTLFVSLAEMAGLEANLVLVLTRDFGKNGLVLPSQDFNHCIVKVMIDEKPQYLELTDRYLPFKALPRTDRGALALEIPRTYDAEKTYDLIRLDSVNRIPNVLEYQLDIHVYDDHKDVTVKASVGGSHKPYTSSMLDEENYDVIKKDLEDRLKEQLGENCSMDTVYNILNEQKNSFVSYTAKVNLEEKIGKIGSFKILEVPHVVNAYTGNIVSEKERKYPIDYLDYESTDEYKMIYDFHLDEGRTFVEIPEDKLFEYAGHKYSRVYEKVDAGHLRVSVHVTPGTQNISPDEYPEYKKYVNLILEAKDEFIGFK